MQNKYIRRAGAAARFLFLSLKGKVIVGSNKYSIKGIYRNKLAIAALNTEDYEKWVNSLFRTVLGIREGAVIDVGANVGQTLIKVLEIDNGRQYVGFEPQISCSFHIDQFITNNKLDNHVIMPIGLGEKRGIAKLGLRGSEDVTASMIKEYRPSGFYSYYSYIPIFPGDEVLPAFNLPSISLVKIDVEGGELEVIKGLSHTIQEHKPYIVFEVLPNYLVATGADLDEDTIEFRNQKHAETDKELRAHKYIIYKIQPEDGFLKIDEIRAAKRQIFNHIAVPEEEAARFTEAYSRR